MTLRERAMRVADDLGFRSLPEKMRIASAIEKELVSVLEAAAVDLEGGGNAPALGRGCADAAAAQVRDFISNPL
jgi:hypothetical protein